VGEPAVSDQVVGDALAEGELQLEGRILPASNATYLASAQHAAGEIRCVYKPVSGERPLWDFPDGSLAGREVAAYVVSEALGWDVVPRTLLRDGPAGPGMVQEWREPHAGEDAVDPVDIIAPGAVPEGFLHVLDALDGDGDPVALVHEDSAPLRRMAVFDAIVNNADRKGGHVLAMADGHRYGVDHGVCFHVDDKLRTVLWGWAAAPVDDTDMVAVERLMEQLATRDSDLRAELAGLVAGPEIDATVRRVARLLRTRRMPVPSGGWPAIPWPAF
jgi:uncharacterized repeat protein (TIGR03843 family)